MRCVGRVGKNKEIKQKQIQRRGAQREIGIKIQRRRDVGREENEIEIMI